MRMPCWLVMGPGELPLRGFLRRQEADDWALSCTSEAVERYERLGRPDLAESREFSEYRVVAVSLEDAAPTEQFV